MPRKADPMGTGWGTLCFTSRPSLGNQSSLSDSAFHATLVPFVGVWMTGCGCDLKGTTKRKSTL